MNEIQGLTCPGCQARLNGDVLRQSGAHVCPFCGKDVADLLLGGDAIAGGTSPETRASTGTSRFTAPPTNSALRVIESTDEKLVVYLPASRSAKGLGWFALAWNGLMAFITTMMVSAVFFGAGKFEGSPLLGIAVVGLFWAVGLGLGYLALKMRYERTFLYVDRQRAVVQKMLFGRQKRHVSEIAEGTHAALEVSHSQNDVPVYRVVILGGSQKLQFGSALSDADKDWLVDRINEQLGVRELSGGSADWTADGETPTVVPTHCATCSAPLPASVTGVVSCPQCGVVYRGISHPLVEERLGRPVARLTPSELPANGPIRIDEDSPAKLRFSFAGCANRVLQIVVPLFAFAFAVFWYSILLAFVVGAFHIPSLWGKIGVLAFLTPFILVGTIPPALGAYMLWGRTRIELTRDVLTCRWQIGRMGYSRSLTVTTLESVRVESTPRNTRNPRALPEVQPADSAEQSACVARGGGKLLNLTTVNSPSVQENVAALIATRLDEWGHKLGTQGPATGE
ncbi:MAG: hypothetical protein NT069_26460 [Planctomycetota bacterium]|nr:hypothetical protein [Planctomycetota bacterium]